MSRVKEKTSQSEPSTKKVSLSEIDRLTFWFPTFRRSASSHSEKLSHTAFLSNPKSKHLHIRESLGRPSLGKNPILFRLQISRQFQPIHFAAIPCISSETSGKACKLPLRARHTGDFRLFSSRRRILRRDSYSAMRRREFA